MPRSGTTLIADLISFHEDLGWFSNHFANFPDFPSLSILNRIVDIPKIGYLLRGKERSSNLNGFKQRLPYPREAYKIWDYYCTPQFSKDYLLNQKPTEIESIRANNVIKKVLRYQGKKRFLNKMTGPSRIGYLSSLFPDACFVHIIRDPRAVVSSLLNVNFWIVNGGLDEPWWQNGLDAQKLEVWEKSNKSPAVLAAVQWSQIIENTLYELSQITANECSYIEIKYEHFVKDPVAGIKKILSFTNLKKSAFIDANLSKRTNVRNMNSKFYKNLSHKQISAIELVTQTVATKIGYNF